METPGQTTASELFLEMAEEFLDRTGMPRGVFGREAMGDPGFVRRLRGGCLAALQALDRVVAFIEAWSPDGGGGFAFSGPGRLRERLSGARRVRWVEREPEEAVPVRMLRLPMVLARTGLSRSTLYELIREGSFPKPVRLSAQAVGWVEAEVDGWVRDRVAESRREADPPTGSGRFLKEETMGRMSWMGRRAVRAAVGQVLAYQAVGEMRTSALANRESLRDGLLLRLPSFYTAPQS